MSWSEDDWGKPFFPVVTIHNESAIIAGYTAQQLSLVFKEAKTTERKKIARIQTLT